MEPKRNHFGSESGLNMIDDGRLRPEAADDKRNPDEQVTAAGLVATTERPDSRSLLARVDALRAKAPGVWATDAAIAEAIDEGRG
jgi:hypothetical protein